MRVRRGSRRAAAASSAADGAAAIQAEGLVKRFDELEAVRGVSFSVPPGQTFGFLGPNSAGKSTTISMLCTLLQPSAGRASVAGLPTTCAPSAWCGGAS
jgi:ABC-type multidrug transport system ATPase subunit